jgi:thiamine monophosphate kinase
LELATGGGEDYELLFTARRRRFTEAELSRRLGVEVTEIGRIVPAEDCALPKIEGWVHF